MKNTLTYLLTAASLLAVQSAFSQYFVDDPTFGADQIYVDTNGLGWLNLNNSFDTGLTINEVIAEFASGETYFGYRYATQAEVKGLFETLTGAVLPAFEGLSYSVSGTSVNPLLEVLGTTESIPISTSIDGPIVGVLSNSQGIFANGYMLFMGSSTGLTGEGWSVGDSQGDFPFGPDQQTVGNASHFLVTTETFSPVPEPATIGLLAFGGLGAMLVIRRRVKARNAIK